MLPLCHGQSELAAVVTVMDAATALTYMQQRYYDPQVGRFLSVDPVVADPNTGADFNRYAYVGNNPANKTDPTGMCESISTCQMEREERAVLAGEMSPEQYRENNAYRAAGVGVGLTVLATRGGILAGLARIFKKDEKTFTRYMGKAEADVAKKGEIPNVGRDGQPRPTHGTTDKPTNSASEAQRKYELPETPTHRATVPQDRVRDIGPAPDGRATTSGGGTQNATSQPIPVKPCEIVELCK